MRISRLAGRGRPWIAMIAAYAVALQMLLTAAVAGQMATMPAGIVPFCAGLVSADGGPDHDGQTPLHQAPCVLCMAGLSAASDHAPCAIAPAFTGKGIVLAAVATAPILPAAPPSPRLSQGPPARM